MVEAQSARRVLSVMAHLRNSCVFVWLTVVIYRTSCDAVRFNPACFVQHWRAVHFLVAMYLSLFSFDCKFYVSSIVSCLRLSLGKERRKGWKTSCISFWQGAEECYEGQRRGGNMYGVGKILQLHGRNANIESSLGFPESDSGLFILEVYIMHPLSSSSLHKTQY